MTKTITHPGQAAAPEQVTGHNFDNGPQEMEFEVAKTMNVTILRWSDATPEFPVLEMVASKITSCLLSRRSGGWPTSINLGFNGKDLDVYWFDGDEPTDAEADAIELIWRAAGGNYVSHGREGPTG